MEQQKNEGATEVAASKTPRVRSVAYPSYTLLHCVDLTERILKEFGKTSFTSREAISKQLRISDSHLQTQLSSSGQYDLLELKAKEGYKPTESFNTIYKPLDEEEKRSTLIQCFRSPELYIKLIEEFDGEQLPSEGGLATILYRKHKISEAASTIAAKVFLENANDLNLIKDGILRIDGAASLQDDEYEELTDPDKEKENQKRLPPPPGVGTKPDVIIPPGKEKAPPIPVLLEGNRTAEVIMPSDYTVEDFKRVLRVIQAYLPE